jgi:hypothetical protein
MMAKYRKKPVVIEAEQFRVDREPWPKGVERDFNREGLQPKGTPGDSRARFYGMRTLEGWYQVTPLDWIITGVKGERYPCKPDIFAETYEPVQAGG